MACIVGRWRAGRVMVFARFGTMSRVELESYRRRSKGIVILREYSRHYGDVKLCAVEKNRSAMEGFEGFQNCQNTAKGF